MRQWGIREIYWASASRYTIDRWTLLNYFVVYVIKLKQAIPIEIVDQQQIMFAETIVAATYPRASRYQGTTELYCVEQ